MREILDREIDRLGADLRQVVILCDLEGLTDEQAARRLRWPVGTVKSRLSRARGRLRDRLSRRGASLAWSTTPPVVPFALVDAASRAAVAALNGGLAATGAGLAGSLIREGVRSMLFRKIAFPAALAAMAGAATMAILGHPRAGGGDSPAPATLPVQAAQDPGQDRLRLSASGRVVDQGGDPVAGARVYIREWVYRRTGTLPPEELAEMERTGELPDILAETATDGDGRFRFEGVVARPFGPEDQPHVGKTYFPWDLVALADGRGVAWERLTPQNQRAPLTLRLPAERPLSGRVAGPGGVPIAGARLKVSDLAALTAPARDFDTSDLRLGLNWSSLPLGATTDADGRFTIRHLPPAMRATLVAMAEGHQTSHVYAATTDEAQPDLEDTTFNLGRREVAKIPVRTGSLTLVLKPNDHVLSGRIVHEGTGRPVAGAMVLNGHDRLGETDADGRFEARGLAAGPVLIHARAKDTGWAPLDVRVEIPEAEKKLERTFELPKGIQVSGRARDAVGPVAGVTVRYENEPDGDNLPSMFLLEAKTGAEGSFRLAVPAGKGRITVVSTPPTHRGTGPRAIGQPPDAGFAKPVEGASGESIEGLDFVLARNAGLVVRAIDPEGKPVPGAEARRYALGPSPPAVLTDEAGIASVEGLDPTAPTTIDLVHPGRGIGKRVEWPDLSAGPIDESGPLEVRLEPLASLEGQALDESGDPLAGPVLYLRSDIRAPEQLGVAVETLNTPGRDGSFRFDGLVPGGSYYVQIEAGGHAGQSSARSEARAGARESLEPFRLPVADRDLEGIVVDPRGQPVAGVSVGLRQEGASTYDRAGTWFMDTDPTGRFALTDLPRGRARLMIYRHPPAGQPINDQIIVEVGPDEREVRIEMPDQRRRLRGIEGKENP
jgi:hypothetical protein